MVYTGKKMVLFRVRLANAKVPQIYCVILFLYRSFLSLRWIFVSGGCLLTNSIVISFNWSVKGLRVCWIYWRNNCKLNPFPFPIKRWREKRTHKYQTPVMAVAWRNSYCRESTSIGCFLIDYRRNQKVQESLFIFEKLVIKRKYKMCAAPRASFSRVYREGILPFGFSTHNNCYSMAFYSSIYSIIVVVVVIIIVCAIHIDAWCFICNYI